MKSKPTPPFVFKIEYIIIILVAIGILTFWLGSRKSEIEFCQKLFSQLNQGRLGAAAAIDWGNFKAFGADYGATYRALSRQGKDNFKEGFILGFTFVSERLGNESKDYSNWRVYKKIGKNTIVAVTAPTKQTLLLTVSDSFGKKRLMGMEYLEDK